ncbi:hypothetical protein Taro_037587, partial [Colocasia esculenta]|nr:hypothetical protein [Colocasia esculenta]
AADVFIKRAKYNGGRATISVWNPKVEAAEELSASLIGITMNDKNIHLHAGWLTNGFDPLCYNLQCPGFVQTNTHTILDSYLEPVSDYGGAQYAIDVAISKDKNTGNWWVYLQGSAMGYWPKDLSPGLADSAQLVSFSGEIYNSNPGGHHTSTEMGSGHFSSEGFRKASFFRNVEVYDDSFQYVSPGAAGDITVDYEHPRCYDAHTVGRKEKLGNWGYYFFYGGPGKSADKCS